MKKLIMIIICITFLLSGCTQMITSNNSLIDDSTYESSNIIYGAESDSQINEKSFSNSYFDQLFDISSYGGWSSEKSNQFLIDIINKDLWYHGAYSKFYPLLGKSLNYVSRIDTTTGSMYYVYYLLKLRDVSDLYSDNEYFFIQMITKVNFKCM